MINLEFNLKLNQKGGTEVEQKQSILGIGMSSTDNRFISFIFIDNDLPLSFNDIDQIKVVYNSNPDTSIRWRDDMADATKWNFQLLKIRHNDDPQGSEKIIGVAGVNLTDKELGYDAIFHSDEENGNIPRSSGYIGFLGKGYYRQLCAERVKNVQAKHPTESFFLFTQHTRLLKIHIDSGLELLDVMPPGDDGTFTCRYSRHVYTRIDGTDYALRLLCNNHKPDNGNGNANKFPNFVRIDKPGMCSGLYIGNGIIITAAHCLKEGGGEAGPNEIDAMVMLDPYNARIRVRGRYHYYPYRNANSTWKDIAVIVIDKNAIADMQLAKIHILDDPVNLPPMHHMDDTQIPNLFMYGFPGGGVRDVTLSKNALSEYIVSSPVQFILREIKRINMYEIGKYPDAPNGLPEGYGNRYKDLLNFVRYEYKKRFTCTNDQTLAIPGDSGGPLFFKNNSNKIMISSVIGNFGETCPLTHRDGQNYGVSFVNTSFFKDWILSKIINPDSKGNEFFIYNLGSQKTRIEGEVVHVPAPVSISAPAPAPAPVDINYLEFISGLDSDTLLPKLDKYKTKISQEIIKLEKELKQVLIDINADGLSDEVYDIISRKKITTVTDISILYANKQSLNIIENFYIDFKYKNKTDQLKVDLGKSIINCNL